MWIKFLVDCRVEGGVLFAGTVFWAQRVGVIRKTAQYQQASSALAIKTSGGLLVLPDDAEGELYTLLAALPGQYWTTEEILEREG